MKKATPKAQLMCDSHLVSVRAGAVHNLSAKLLNVNAVSLHWDGMCCSIFVFFLGSVHEGMRARVCVNVRGTNRQARLRLKLLLICSV